MIRRCCARPSKASSTSRKNTVTRCTTPSRPTTTTTCWRSSANTGWVSTVPAATSSARPSRRASTPRVSSMRVWASATRSCATPSSRISWPSTASRSRSWSWSMPWPGRPGAWPTWRCASTPTSTPRPTTASIRGRLTVSSAFHMKRYSSTPRRSARSSISI